MKHKEIKIECEDEGERRNRLSSALVLNGEKFFGKFTQPVATNG
jgi:hypothetical protein